MNSSIKNIIGAFVLFATLTGCFDPPEFPSEPKINFSNIRFVETDRSDSLVLTFEFQDGDGDIGLRNEETAPPFHSKDYILDSDFTFVTFSGSGYDPPFYKINDYDDSPSPEFYSDEDTRPTYNCRNYLYDTLFFNNGDSILAVADTFYVVPNEFNKNIFIDIYRKINGQYININDAFSANINCPESFSARFPIFDVNNIGKALSGRISYAMISSGFGTVFRNDSIMIEFYIYDRALNKSNVARTPDFILEDIR